MVNAWMHAKSVISNQVNQDYPEWFLGHSKSPYYTLKESERRESPGIHANPEHARNNSDIHLKSGCPVANAYYFIE
jgi:hypothetical protein